MQQPTTLSQLVNLSGKTAIVTGGGAGIGKAITYRLAEAGANVIITGRSEDKLRAAIADLKHLEVEITPAAFDLAELGAIESFWNELDLVPDILVNNAGVFPFSDYLELDANTWQKVMDINLNAVNGMCFHFIKKLKESEQGGAIVNIGSVESELPFQPDLVHYSVSKAGVVALTRALAAEYGRSGIRVNAVLPGGVNTDGAKETYLENIKKLNFGVLIDSLSFGRRVPLGRVGEPDDIAKMVLVMASDLSGYMTGAVVPVDGGILSN